MTRWLGLLLCTAMLTACGNVPNIANDSTSWDSMSYTSQYNKVPGTLSLN